MAQVWANKLTDTSLRPYTSMFLVIPVVPEDMPANVAALAADENGFSSVFSMLRGSYDSMQRRLRKYCATLPLRLYDSTKIAIDVGRERMGTDKRPGNTALKREGSSLDLSITDGFRTRLNPRPLESDRGTTSIHARDCKGRLYCRNRFQPDARWHRVCFPCRRSHRAPAVYELAVAHRLRC